MATTSGLDIRPEPDHRFPPDERVSSGQHRQLARSVISSPVWKRFTSTVTLVMVGAAVIVGASVGLSGPAVSPVSPAVAAAADTPAAATANAPAQGRAGAPRGAVGGDGGNGGPRNGRR